MEADFPPAELQDLRLCEMCGDELTGDYFRVGHVLSVLRLAVCKECFSGRQTWYDLGDEYFSDYLEDFAVLKSEVEESLRRRREMYED